MDESLIEREIMQFIHAAVKCPPQAMKKRARLLLSIKAAYFPELQSVKGQGVELSLLVSKGQGA